MGGGRRANIPKEIKDEIITYVSNNKMGLKFTTTVINRVSIYNNKKQTFELLAEIASLPCIKELNYDEIKQMDFSDDARQLVKSIGCKDEYTDPDLYSLVLYLVWGKFLIRKGILVDYRIIYHNAFAIEGIYKNDKGEARVILGADGIPINQIEKYGYEKKVYKSLGSFLIWPRHSGYTINQKKGMKLKDDWEAILEEVEKYYNESSDFFENPIDIEWMNYIGGIKKEVKGYGSFKWCFELDNLILDENRIISKDSIERRNVAMWNVINK